MSNRTTDLKTARWGDRKSLLQQLQRLWDRGLLLQETLHSSELFPKRLKFRTPDSRSLSSEFDTVRHWVSECHKLNGFRVVTRTVRHRVIGENSLPAEVWVDDLQSAITLLHKQAEIDQFRKLCAHTQQLAPQLMEWITQNPLKLLALASDWPRLIDFVRWRQQHPAQHIYLREISLPGIDSKFIEHYRPVLAALLDASLEVEHIQSEIKGLRQFEQRYGFRSKPQRIRFRLLDSDFELLPGSDKDHSLSAADFRVLYRKRDFAAHIRRVFITENEINFLAFPAHKKSLVIFGAGYGFSALAQADWLSKLEVYYWGDIDTHGFAILDQLRHRFAHVKSLLMNEQTLLSHRPFWGQEEHPEGRALERLTPDELSLYKDLLEHKFQPNLRLEQERIQFTYLLEELARLDG